MSPFMGKGYLSQLRGVPLEEGGKVVADVEGTSCSGNVPLVSDSCLSNDRA
ncbi:hypothetical protein PQX77_014857 [Marasmius sp. AFHP31]|nr:hypothetical protein PQX77_014857 [Marasmius sp. AFHP31]